jgi:peptidoglycan/LPS O-acetylase OafA/YrhL
MHIADRTECRDNNFNLIRFAAASGVIWFHSYALALKPADEPLFRSFLHPFDVGFLAVAAFFVVSGFLVTRSFAMRRTPIAFVAARLLRIYPGLALAALFTVVLAGICSTLPWRDYLSAPATHEYLWRTATGWNIVDTLPGAFATNPYPRVVNGSLWTLPLELRMYLGCLIAGLLGLFQRTWMFNITFAMGVALFWLMPEWFPIEQGRWIARQLGLAFALGGLAWVNRNRIPISPLAAGAAGLLLLVSPVSLRSILVLPVLAYALLAFAMHPMFQIPAFTRTGDYSYGLYIYAFPIQQALLSRPGPPDPVAIFAWTFPAALALAFISWHVVEKPALRLKSLPVWLASPSSARNGP